MIEALIQSHATASKVFDVISRLPGCAGEANDAVSASPQVKLEYAPKVLRFPEAECPVIWIRLPRAPSPKSAEHIPDRVVPRKFGRTPLSSVFVGTKTRRGSVRRRIGNSTRMGILTCASKSVTFLSIYVDGIQNGSQKG